MECSACSNPFKIDGRRQPRMLQCGHTFCTDCIDKVSYQNHIQCPYCPVVTRFKVGAGAYALPVNSILVQLIHKKMQKDKAEGIACSEEVCLCLCNKQEKKETCRNCRAEEATKICFSCDPTGCKLCEACCSSEHERDFPPVRAHKPVLIKNVKEMSRYKCGTHDGQPLTHYSEKTGTFACEAYLESQSDEVKADYEQLEAVVHTLKSRATAIMQNLEEYQIRLESSYHKISTMQNQLMEKGPKTIAEIRKQFGEFQSVFQQRQNALLTNVKEYLTRCNGRSESQLWELREITVKLIHQKDQLKLFMQKDGKDFLENYRNTRNTRINTCNLLNAENPALQRSVCEANIPVYIPDDFITNLCSVISVAGGPDIIDLKIIMQNGLLYLKWNVQHRIYKIREYEIEYQVVPASHNSEGPSSIICNGNTLHHYMNCLCPGWTYTFRMRSAIFSGWGMWTSPLTTKYDDFPSTITYTRKIVQIKIPTTGRYQITAKGAKAADGKHQKGGRGAIISAVFTLQAGDILDILCGGKSDCQGNHSGGGGGTFVSVNTRDLQGLLVVAGGGGGTRGADKDVDGLDANLEPHGTMANATNCAEGGIDGAPGADAMFTGPAWGHGGAGWEQSSTTAKSFVDGGDGGECGGFGGGGGVGMYGGGGGGGFSGGGGGRGGGGGGSYVRADGDNVTKEIGHMEHGEVRIVKLPNDSSANNTNEIIVLSDTSSSSSSKELAVLSPGSTSLSSTSEQ